MKKRMLSVMLAWMSAVLAAAEVCSPDGKVIWQEKAKGFSIVYRDGNTLRTVLEVPTVGMNTLDDGGGDLRLTDVSPARQLTEAYEMLAGKQRSCHNEANEVSYSYVYAGGRSLKLQVRAYNDGIAFRYLLDSPTHTHAPQEQTTYLIPEGTRRWMQPWTEPYEAFFPLATTGQGEHRRWGYPALLQVPGAEVYALITEAGIARNHSASSLYNDRRPEEYRVVMDKNEQDIHGSWASPWRVVMVGSLQHIVASTLVTDVSEPCRLADTSWIQPGSVAWIYWAYNHGSNDYQIVRQYVDLAVAMHWPYVLIDAEWDEMRNGGDVEAAIRYAHAQGIKPLLWYNSSTAWLKAWGAPGPHERLNNPDNREREFAWLQKMGVAGVKIDFFAGDSQQTMAYCIDLLECAARHQLMVNFHGATIPRGWQRTYPNLLTVEAVYGAEWYNNNGTLTTRAAAHNATLPFTRNVIGPMDYTPCTFSNSQHPHITTHAHELALAVLFESPLLHWADRPEAYLAQPQAVRDLMSALPTVWDETRLLAGYPGEGVVMARRSGSTWYIAGINGKDEPQTLSFDSSFLKGRRATYYLDATGEAIVTPETKAWTIRHGRVRGKVTCQARGGFVIKTEE